MSSKLDYDAVSEGYFLEEIGALPYSEKVALDIGAHHGLYTNLLAKTHKHCYAFEPDPKHAKVLSTNITCDNVTIVEKAITEKDGPVQYYPDVMSVAPAYTWYRGYPFQVSGISLDTFCKDLEVGTIKCDIEAAEDFVFYGGIETLRRNNITLFLETHKPNLVNLTKLNHLFHLLGYQDISDKTGSLNSMEYHDHHYKIRK